MKHVFWILILFFSFSSFKAFSKTYAPVSKTQAQMFSFLRKDTALCGFACLYKKGNENLILQALYLLKKLEKLEKASKTSSNSNNSFSKTIQNELPGFCHAKKDLDLKTSAQLPAIDAKKCFLRWKRQVKLRLYQIKAAMIQHEFAAHSLESSPPLLSQQKNSVSTPVIPKVFKESATSIKPITPNIPTLYELSAIYKTQIQHTRRYGSQNYVQWAQQLPTAPARESFLKFKFIPKDPHQPKGPKAMVPDTSCGKDLCYDQAAYQKALNQYQKKNTNTQKTISDLLENAKNTLQTKPIQDEIKNFEKDQVNKKPLMEKALKTTELSKKAFIEVRNKLALRTHQVLSTAQIQVSPSVYVVTFKKTDKMPKVKTVPFSVPSKTNPSNTTKRKPSSPNTSSSQGNQTTYVQKQHTTLDQFSKQLAKSNKEVLVNEVKSLPQGSSFQNFSIGLDPQQLEQEIDGIDIGIP